MKTDGIFTCEKPGLYFVSSQIVTDTNDNYYLSKNGGAIGFGYFSLNGNLQTSTLVFMLLLSENDTLSVGIGLTNRIVGDYTSCISILQLTG